ncbi:RNA-binding domain-containing protein [Hortaea werneckii]|nr:RNA-binding domain-containing protein [Hortaea werneckii]KAI7105378.1 RNA-binding domain-containing protein [Hortaea werneckii]KAI7235519.1 RNA-binding domain-containing protein [Hortaea werneckii]KAI7334333.1 RNA-binding domain-containing protein [Hortaea werneckii]KAI7334781.1 RNA-binding domain-containing protein [Hortaea werneckii]
MAPAVKKQRLSNGGFAAIEEAETEQSAPQKQGTEKEAPKDGKPDSKDEKAEQTRRSLFVRSLPATTTSESLTELFSESFPIKHATAVIDKESKQCKGYGFVTFADAEDAQRAREQFNGHVLDGRKLRVEVAEPRHREDGVAKEKVKPERETQQPPKLIVRNLPWSIKGSHQLEKLFQSYGKVKQAYVPRKGPGLMAGFGFVLMRGRKNAEKAIEGINGKEVDGRTLAVDWSVEKEAYQNMQQNGDSQVEETEPNVKSDGEEMDEGSDGDLDEPEDLEDVSDEDSNVSAESDDEGGVDVDASGEENEEVSDDDGDKELEEANRTEDKSSTLFVRNLPFTCTDEGLEDHFTQFGSVRYARVVMDYGTERSKGTGFVCFYNREDASACLREAPKRPMPAEAEKGKDGKTQPAAKSILQDEDADPTGKFTLDGRVLQVSRAVEKSEANRLTEEGEAHRRKRGEDKRRLYLLSEGTISPKSKLFEKLAPSEKTMREASFKQRKTLLENNGSLNLSLTRLSVRNIPRSIDSRDLKNLAREAVVGFATDVKNNVREKLSKEELARGGEAMVEAEAARKRAGKGLVKQAKVVFEGSGGSKVSEDSGAGRSRGYGFIEYYTHRSALMALRWLNGHAIGYQVKENAKGNKELSREDIQDRKKRLIVEFAIENAQVVMRRGEREAKARERSRAVQEGRAPSFKGDAAKKEAAKNQKFKRDRKEGKSGPLKRKRGSDDAVQGRKPGKKASGGDADKPNAGKKEGDEKLAKRNQIIGRKRAMRKSRSGGKS